eukprot:gene4999-34783_t
MQPRSPFGGPISAKGGSESILQVSAGAGKELARCRRLKHQSSLKDFEGTDGCIRALPLGGLSLPRAVELASCRRLRHQSSLKDFERPHGCKPSGWVMGAPFILHSFIGDLRTSDASWMAAGQPWRVKLWNTMSSSLVYSNDNSIKASKRCQNVIDSFSYSYPPVTHMFPTCAKLLFSNKGAASSLRSSQSSILTLLSMAEALAAIVFAPGSRTRDDKVLSTLLEYPARIFVAVAETILLLGRLSIPPQHSKAGQAGQEVGPSGRLACNEEGRKGSTSSCFRQDAILTVNVVSFMWNAETRQVSPASKPKGARKETSAIRALKKMYRSVAGAFTGCFKGTQAPAKGKPGQSITGSSAELVVFRDNSESDVNLDWSGMAVAKVNSSEGGCTGCCMTCTCQACEYGECSYTIESSSSSIPNKRSSWGGNSSCIGERCGKPNCDSSRCICQEPGALYLGSYTNDRIISAATSRKSAASDGTKSMSSAPKSSNRVELTEGRESDWIQMAAATALLMLGAPPKKEAATSLLLLKGAPPKEEKAAASALLLLKGPPPKEEKAAASALLLLKGPPPKEEKAAASALLLLKGAPPNEEKAATSALPAVGRAPPRPRRRRRPASALAAVEGRPAPSRGRQARGRTFSTASLGAPPREEKAAASALLLLKGAPPKEDKAAASALLLLKGALPKEEKAAASALLLLKGAPPKEEKAAASALLLLKGAPPKGAPPKKEKAAASALLLLKGAPPKEDKAAASALLLLKGAPPKEKKAAASELLLLKGAPPKEEKAAASALLLLKGAPPKEDKAAASALLLTLGDKPKKEEAALTALLMLRNKPKEEEEAATSLQVLKGNTPKNEEEAATTLLLLGSSDTSDDEDSCGVDDIILELELRALDLTTLVLKGCMPGGTKGMSSGDKSSSSVELTDTRKSDYLEAANLEEAAATALLLLGDTPKEEEAATSPPLLGSSDTSDDVDSCGVDDIILELELRAMDLMILVLKGYLPDATKGISGGV